MANITVKFYSLWSLYLNTDQLTFEANNLDEAMEKLDNLFGNQLRNELRKHKLPYSGTLKESSTILLNGVSLRNLKGTLLADGDVLQVFPPVAGG